MVPVDQSFGSAALTDDTVETLSRVTENDESEFPSQRSRRLLGDWRHVSTLLLILEESGTCVAVRIERPARRRQFSVIELARKAVQRH
ncbi:hypothetical protein [Chondromyces crocatus]|uniref:hypothetical protein n=1 Tax=Chondromyces crocatus TaxID=52 RepID=UPI001C54CAD8|nr:hypothetical protein [Chondromyces crocatus]